MKTSFSGLLVVFLFFLPFTQALTLNIGFSLKISEILALLIVFFLIIKESDPTISLKTEYILLLGFVFWAALSFIVNTYWSYDYPPKEVPYRINRIGDSFLRLGYIFINIAAYFFCIKFLSKKAHLLNYWVKGALIAAIYGWYLFVSSYLDIPYLKLPGMMENPQTLRGIIRCGTFKEGNFFGMFLLLSAALSFYLGKPKSGWFLLLSIFSTFSTISFISGLFFLIIFYFDKIRSKKGIKSILILFTLFILASPFLVNTEFFQSNVRGKLLDPSNEITANNFSSIDRKHTARIAFKLGVNNPILGVGPNNYGNHYDQYNNIEKRLNFIPDFFVEYFARKEKRAIPNNVFLEVWAEYGIVGFIFYVLFLLKTVLSAYRIKERAIFAGCLALLLSMNAFPSFIMLFIWVFLAIPSAIKESRQRGRVELNG